MIFAAAVATALHLIVLHDGEHHPLALNAEEISSLRAPGEGEGGYAQGIRCVVIMTNGKFFGVSETCQEVFLKTKDVP